MPQPSSTLKATTVCTLIAAALTVVAPFAVRGVACGHDLTFHMNSWLEVAQQWRAGVLYPRWAANANYGSGEPRFLFYPPLSWILGGALGSFIPWLFVPVAFDGCAVFLAGLAMHCMAREWFEEPDATLIAVAYAVNPYMLLTIYVRSAFAELLAASFSAAAGAVDRARSSRARDVRAAGADHRGSLADQCSGGDHCVVCCSAAAGDGDHHAAQLARVSVWRGAIAMGLLLAVVLHCSRSV